MSGDSLVETIIDTVVDEAMDRVGRGSRRRVLVVVAVAVVLAGLIAAFVIVMGRSDPTYDDATRSRFMDACTADGGDPVRGTCECIYDGIVASIPYDRFEDVDKLLREQAASNEKLVLPDDIDAIRRNCVKVS